MFIVKNIIIYTLIIIFLYLILKFIFNKYNKLLEGMSDEESSIEEKDLSILSNLKRDLINLPKKMTVNLQNSSPNLENLKEKIKKINNLLQNQENKINTMIENQEKCLNSSTD